MRISDFDLYKELLKKKSGLTLTPDKSYLLDSRLTPVAKKWGHASLDAMTLVLRGAPDPDMVRDVVEAMTTNETSFFRDTKPFDMFSNTVLP
ncbi:MAG TPA: protein-glutamate O-methyltransferase CheR, partial [Micavibrio sp.]